MLAILAPQWQGGNTSPCHCEARIASFGVPAVIFTPNPLKYVNYTTRWCNFHRRDTVCPTRHDAVTHANKTPPPFPRPLPTRPGPTIASAGCVSRFRVRALPPKKSTIFCIVVRVPIPNRDSPFSSWEQCALQRGHPICHN